MVYSVKEMFKTLQGEGAQAGRAAVFCRFAGCNLWSGRERDRATAACTFCDTDFVGTDGHGGGKFIDAPTLAARLAQTWGPDTSHRYVVFTGGEPLLQLDSVLIDAVRGQRFTIAIETNGTQVVPAGIDWVCVSPKGNNALAVKHGNELKLVYPQPDAPPERFKVLAFDHFFIQPMDDSQPMGGSSLRSAHTAQAVEYCLQNPQWRLSIQSHKYIGIA
jgi:7-carboxy-7-deazaguanine synthase (Cx14CxxC type)